MRLPIWASLKVKEVVGVDNLNAMLSTPISSTSKVVSSATREANRSRVRLWRAKKLATNPRFTADQATKYRKEHPEEYREKSRDWARQHRAKIRKAILAAYGGRCTCCGESEEKFLALDHINNDGSSHRAALGKFQKVYDWAVKNDFPDNLQLLCHNCNLSKSFYGCCPHNEVK